MDSSTPHILHQNAEHNIVLLDIPSSIAAAQGRAGTLLSTEPLQAPIPFPQQHRSRAPNAQDAATAALHAEYKALIQHALAHLGAHVSGPWCAPRKLMMQVPRCEKDQARDADDPERALECRLREWAAWGESRRRTLALDLNQMMASLGASAGYMQTAADPVAHPWQRVYHVVPDATHSTHVKPSDSQDKVTESWSPTLHNPAGLPLKLVVFSDQTQSDPRYCFTIPPHSTFFLSDSTHSDAFRSTFRQLTDEYGLRRHFDLVLLDPPWPNRSAKRKGAYEQVGGMPFLKRMLLRMDVDSYLAHKAWVGVWITNKDALRSHVLGPGGLFETWNVGLMEEWVWIKTTTNGEAMFDMDSVVRKPYEILLLGRAAPNAWTAVAHAPVVKRRVIAAVPDMHSRKPCLKGLFESFGLVPQGYSALEVFSRYLVAGWMSWGNEVLKFNWDAYWTTKDGVEARESTT